MLPQDYARLLLQTGFRPHQLDSLVSGTQNSPGMLGSLGSQPTSFGPGPPGLPPGFPSSLSGLRLPPSLMPGPGDSGRTMADNGLMGHDHSDDDREPDSEEQDDDGEEP